MLVGITTDPPGPVYPVSVANHRHLSGNNMAQHRILVARSPLPERQETTHRESREFFVWPNSLAYSYKSDQVKQA